MLFAIGMFLSYKIMKVAIEEEKTRLELLREVRKSREEMMKHVGFHA